MTGDVLLALDGGGTRTRSLAVSRDGTVLGRAETAASNDLQLGADAARAAVAHALREALAEAGVSAGAVAATSAGLAGVDVDGTGGGRWMEILRGMGFRRALVHGDMIIAHRGALAGAGGVVVVAGTGSVAVGIDERCAVVKVGGWGPIYGNEGSAYWIGREGLRAAARAADGRGPATGLVERLGEALRVENFARSLDVVYASAIGQLEIASLAPHVTAAAEAGDHVASEICAAAASDLAEAVIAAADRLAAAGARSASRRISYQGGILLNCTGIRQEFHAILRRWDPAVDVRPPRVPPVLGAFLIGCDTLGWDAGAALARLSASSGAGARQT